MHKALLAVAWSASIAIADPLHVPGEDPTATITKQRVQISREITFDGDALTAEGKQMVDAVAATMANDPTLKIEIRGAHAGVVRDEMLAQGVITERLAVKEGKGQIELAVVGHIKLPDVRPPVAADLATYVKNIPGDGALVATIATSKGTIHCELLDGAAPITVANFVGLATGQKPWTDPNTKKTVKNKPYYDGLTFHRVIPKFMIQGGDPSGTGSGFPGYTFGLETSQKLAWQPGTLAMANAGPNTNGSQFFITETAPDYLKDGYTIFGRCSDTDVVRDIAAVPRDKLDKPKDPVTIDKVTIGRAAKP